jgi:gamma-glutamylcyclotransferase (GGCT)/AIG2-like uncharacterized protein YtfP
MLDQIFVYGSLTSAIRHPQGERLRAEADLLGPGWLQAKLYRVGWYPGIVPSSEAADRVHGEIYRLRTPSASLQWLDEYEGLTAGVTSVAATDEYERRILSVHDARGASVSAWVYVYRRDVAGLARVHSGVWAG